MTEQELMALGRLCEGLAEAINGLPLPEQLRAENVRLRACVAELEESLRRLTMKVNPHLADHTEIAIVSKAGDVRRANRSLRAWIAEHGRFEGVWPIGRVVLPESPASLVGWSEMDKSWAREAVWIFALPGIGITRSVSIPHRESKDRSPREITDLRSLHAEESAWQILHQKWPRITFEVADP